MPNVKNTYQEHINGVIFTLIFHILFFSTLNLRQIKVKNKYDEPSIIIDFPLEVNQPEPSRPETNQKKSEKTGDLSTLSDHPQTTNVASNKALNNNTPATSNDNIAASSDYQSELDKARALVKDVSKQLNKEIPTVNDLKMPVERTKGMSPDSILKKLYSGDSNVEYYLDKRYHEELPIPIYLSQYGGTVKVDIVVDRNGNVVSAKPIDTGNISEQLLSYAKTAAIRTKFNKSQQAPENQQGYIKYHFIAQ